MAVVVAALTVAGCSGQEPPEPDDYAAEVAQTLAEGGPGLPGWLAQDWEESLLGELATLDRTVEVVSVGEPVEGEGDRPVTAQARLRWTWQLPGGQEWRQERPVRLTLAEGEGDEERRWTSTPDPSWLAEGLEPGDEVAVRRLPADRADILDGTGQPVVTSRPVRRLGLDKTLLPDGADEQAVREAAREVAELVGVDPAGFADRAAAAGPEAFVEAYPVRESDPSVSLAELEAVPGGRAVPDELPLAPTSSWAAPLLGRAGQATAELVEESGGRVSPGDVVGLSGLQRRLDAVLGGTPGTAVVATGEDGEERVLAEVPPEDGRPVQVTLDSDLQTAAEELLAEEDRPAALVALRPSDGHVLAAAVSPGAQGQSLAMLAARPPGSTFKVVTTLALLRAGLTPESPVECPPEVTVDGYRITNFPGYPASATGTITLREAIAHSCNTALVNERDQLQPAALREAARSLGMDRDTGQAVWEHSLGDVPEAPAGTGLAAATFGQGQVQASPLAVATMGASVAAGRTVVPVLVTEPEDVADDPAAGAGEQPTPLTEEEAGALREVMGAVVTDGGARDVLGDVPGPPVLAKTGSAEVGSGEEMAVDSWMVAAQGDLVVSAWVQDGGYGSVTAGPLVRELLQAGPTG
ncbi:penicillin-binding transpeptidase domain-containing protein [Ornithinicoccus halotolerans]|uniref:penicillin-binding transpeptidase domain-containing protein n=1 Tax=Ornithinicoccus halotolerans TaxID=1748220 RepID=UPI001885D937|nr:penicillin-binding transpeptidase domain-containing protein [Ornithinicoccus halotolerans]